MKPRNLKKFPLENNFLKKINHFSLVLFSNIDFIHNVSRTQSFPIQYRLYFCVSFPFPIPNRMSFQVIMIDNKSLLFDRHILYYLLFNPLVPFSFSHLQMQHFNP